MSEPTPAAAAALATPPATPPSATPAAAPSSAASEAAAPSTPTVATPATPAPATPHPDASLNILAASAEPATPATPPQPITSDPLPLTSPEALATRVTAISAAVKPSDLGLGLTAEGTPVGWDSAAVNIVAEIAAKHDLKPEAVAEIVEGYARHARQQAAASAAEDARVNTDMVAQLRATFGPDLPRRCQEADRGGLSVFGPELWPEIRSVNAFVNDHRVLAALAARGRAIATDPLPGGPGKTTEEQDLATRMYPDLPK